jgi:hypothetical protein
MESMALARVRLKSLSRSAQNRRILLGPFLIAPLEPSIFGENLVHFATNSAKPIQPGKPA